MAETRALEALMFKPSASDYSAPDFKVVDERKVNYFRWLGWFLLVAESTIRDQGIEDVRRDDESRFGPR